MTLVTRDFHNVEIFAVGEWNGRKFTHRDLDMIVKSYQDTRSKLDIPIKLGHTDKQTLLENDGLPAAGWLENVRRAGNKLIADFTKVPSKVADLIESGAFRKRSIELNPNFKVGDDTHSLVLTGIALLGSKLPAVDGLADIVALYEREQLETEQEKAELYLFEESDNDTLDSVLEAISAAHSRAERYFKGKPGAPVLRSLHRGFVEGILRANKLTHDRKDDSDMTLEADLREKFGIAEDADLMAELEKLTTKTPPPPKGDDKKEESTEEFGKMQERLLQLEGQIAENAAVSAVEDLMKNGQLLPAQRDTALAMARRDMTSFKAFADTLPKGRVDFSEHGSESNQNFAKFEPTAAEIAIATQMGTWSPEYRISLMRQKASKDGIELPMDFGKEKASA